MRIQCHNHNHIKIYTYALYSYTNTPDANGKMPSQRNPPRPPSALDTERANIKQLPTYRSMYLGTYHRATPTTPLLPNHPTTPFFNRNCFSIISSDTPSLSLIAKTCLILTTSRNSRPGWLCRPMDSNSRSAAFSSWAREERVSSAGFDDLEFVVEDVVGGGKTEESGCWCCWCCRCWLKRLLGVTGPMERREAAK